MKATLLDHVVLWPKHGLPKHRKPGETFDVVSQRQNAHGKLYRLSEGGKVFDGWIPGHRLNVSE